MQVNQNTQTVSNSACQPHNLASLQDICMICHLQTTLSVISVPILLQPGKSYTKNITAHPYLPKFQSKTKTRQLIEQFSCEPTSHGHAPQIDNQILQNFTPEEQLKIESLVYHIPKRSHPSDTRNDGVLKNTHMNIMNRCEKVRRSENKSKLSFEGKDIRPRSRVIGPNESMKQSTITFSPLRIDISLPSLSSEDLNEYKEQRQIISQIESDIKVLIKKIQASHCNQDEINLNSST